MPKLTSNGNMDYGLPEYDPNDPMFNALMQGGGMSTKGANFTDPPVDPAPTVPTTIYPGQDPTGGPTMEHMPTVVTGGGPFPNNAPPKTAPAPTADKSGAFSNYLLGILGNTQPGSANFQSLLDSANQGYGFGPNQDGGALWDPNRQIIELQGGYATFENGAWKFTQKGPEGDAGGGGGNDTITTLLTQLLGKDSQSRQQIQDFITKNSAPVSAEDPLISGPSSAYEGQIGRSLRDYQEKLAERAYAEGVPSGAFDSALGNAFKQAGQAKGSYTADLVTNENTNRRNAVLGALGLGSAATSQDLSMLLTNKGQNQQNQQFYDDFSKSLSDGLTSQDKLLMELLLGGSGVGA